MVVEPSVRHFGWLALHVMHACSERLGLSHAGENIRLPILAYLPINSYGREVIAGKGTGYIFWNGHGIGMSPTTNE